MKVLFIGDIMGRCGRDAVFDLLADIKDKHAIDYTVANGENASGGLGMNEKGYSELTRAGVDFFTMGNHTFSKKSIIALFERGESIVRPANMPVGTPGDGMAIVNTRSGHKIAIINLIGRIYINENNPSPFETAAELVKKAKERTNIILVDFHAEATSEKEALGYFLDGSVSAVVGTHTHIQTADERILPHGTAYMTDLGRTGAINSVLGLDISASLARFAGLDGKKPPFKVATGRAHLCGAIIDIDEQTGLSKGIERICVSQK